MAMGGIIRERRRALGLTQEQAAARLGVTAGAFNKWERGVSMPDIALLPALARLLGVDMNALFGFGAELTDSEIGEFLNELDALAQSEGCAGAFRRAEAKIREYPGSEKLLLSAAYYLEGALGLSGGGDEYRERLDAWYERLLMSKDAEIREAAMVMVLARCRERRDFSRAEELLDSLPRPQIDREEQQALLLGAEGRADEARRIWQRRALTRITQALTAMQHLASDALKEGRREDAESIAGTIYAVTLSGGLPEWLGLASLAAVAEEAGEAEEYARYAEKLKAALREPPPCSPSPVYGELSAEGAGRLAESLARLLDER